MQERFESQNQRWKQQQAIRSAGQASDEVGASQQLQSSAAAAAVSAITPDAWPSGPIRSDTASDFKEIYPTVLVSILILPLADRRVTPVPAVMPTSFTASI